MGGEQKLDSSSKTNNLQRICSLTEQNEHLRLALHKAEAERDAALARNRSLQSEMESLRRDRTVEREAGSTSSFSIGDASEEIERWILMKGGHLMGVEEMLKMYTDHIRNNLLVPLDRLFVGGLIHEGAAAYVWKWETGFPFEEHEIPRDVFKNREKVFSSDEPFIVLMNGQATNVRMRSSDSVFPRDCKWFVQENYQDYLALPMYNRENTFTGAIGYCTKSEAGFTDEQIQFFHRSVTALTSVIRFHTKDIEAKTIGKCMEDEISERTEELEKQNRDLEAANQLIEQRAAVQLKHFAMMSHEIRTPLNCVIGMSSLLETMDLDESQAESVNMIVKSGELLANVVNDVLDYASLETGKFEIVLAPNSLRDIVDTVVTSMEFKAKTRGVVIATSRNPNVPRIVQTDGLRLQQILYNVLGNAVKFSDVGGTVRLSVDILDDERTLQFVVQDTGRGIEEEKLATIFEPFNQGDISTAGTYGGTGLGLSITSKLVRGMGGTISAKSVIGEWSEFTITLPSCVDPSNNAPVDSIQTGQYSFEKPAHLNSGFRAKSTGEESKRCSDEDQVLMKSLRVLVAEDNLVNQKIMNRILQRLGVADVDIVENGRDAVERESTGVYDVILMDMQMPIMGGIEATTRIISRERKTQPPKIVFVTANALQTHQKQAQDAGGCGFISKPFNIEKMRGLLESLFVEV